MGRFDSTQSIGVPELEHSVVELPWGVLRGAFGPSDGSVGASSNVPSAISVLRHAALYLRVPEEIDDAFGVLEQHAIRHGVVYPVTLAIVPFLFDIVRRGSPVSERIAQLPHLAPEVLLALIELGEAPPHAIVLAMELIGSDVATTRMCAA